MFKNLFKKKKTIAPLDRESGALFTAKDAQHLAKHYGIEISGPSPNITIEGHIWEGKQQPDVTVVNNIWISTPFTHDD